MLPECSFWVLNYEAVIKTGGSNQDRLHPLLSVGPVYDDMFTSKNDFLFQIPLFSFNTNCPLPF
jgi:hypothetical protein